MMTTLGGCKLRRLSVELWARAHTAPAQLELGGAQTAAGGRRQPGPGAEIAGWNQETEEEEEERDGRRTQVRGNGAGNVPSNSAASEDGRLSPSAIQRPKAAKTGTDARTCVMEPPPPRCADVAPTLRHVAPSSWCRGGEKHIVKLTEQEVTRL
ncbi:uncharacterized protein LOC144053068 isoform X2 [Vanacampus margaritifer]